MKNYFKVGLIALIFLGARVGGNAQVVISNIQNVPTEVNGEYFYTHEVLKGQTLYSIARAYKASVPKLYELNPTAKAGLRIGQKLKIPAPGPAPEGKLESIQESQPEPIAEMAERKVVLSEPKVEERKELEVVPPRQAKNKTVDETIEEQLGEAQITEELKSGQEPQRSKLDDEKQDEESISSSRGNILDAITNGQMHGTVKEQVTKPETVKEPSIKTKAQKADQLTTNEIANSPIEIEVDKVAVPTNAVFENSIENSYEKPFPALDADGNQLELTLDQRLKTVAKDKDSIMLREYFFFFISPDGSVLKIEDQRTETNANSNYFGSQDVLKMKEEKFKGLAAANITKAPIGLEGIGLAHTYDAKIKKKKIRLYNQPLFVEHIKPTHLHYKAIMSYAGGKRGKIKLRLVDIQANISVYEQLEYNPFAVVSKKLHDQHLIAIIDATWKK